MTKKDLKPLDGGLPRGIPLHGRPQCLPVHLNVFKPGWYPDDEGITWVQVEEEILRGRNSSVREFQLETEIYIYIYISIYTVILWHLRGQMPQSEDAQVPDIKWHSICI